MLAKPAGSFALDLSRPFGNPQDGAVSCNIEPGLICSCPESAAVLDGLVTVLFFETSENANSWIVTKQIMVAWGGSGEV